MVDSHFLSIAIDALVKSAPSWLSVLRDPLLNTFMDRGVEPAMQFARKRLNLDEKELTRHLELALKNAVERGLARFQTPEDRVQYRNILNILSEDGPHSEELRSEALRLFTLSDSPNLVGLTEKYNLSQRISVIAQDKTHQKVDATPYLSSFFEALISEFYNDPFFREQMGDVIKVRAALKGQRTLEDIIAILSQISSNLADAYTTEQFKRDLDKYMEFIETKLRHHEFVGIILKGDEDTSPELDTIFVPLRITIQGQVITETISQNDIISLLEQFPYLVLLGGPGSGKSTTTRHLAWHHAVANASTLSSSKSKNTFLLSGKPVPLRIELRRLTEARRQRPNYSFISYATEVLLGREGVSINAQMFAELLERRVMLLLFDGLDEVSTLDERRQLIKEIEMFAQLYPGNRILVTSRPVGYDIASFSKRWFKHGLIQEFNDEQIHSFLEGWYTHVLKHAFLSTDVRSELELFYTTLKNNPRLHTLATNPLLLTAMTALHRHERLPDKRVQVYEKCADLLLDTWAKLRNTDTRWRDMKMGKDDQNACIAHLGFVLHKRSHEEGESEVSSAGRTTQSKEDAATDVPARFMRREIERFLHNRKLIAEAAEQHAEAKRFLELMQVEAGLIVERGTDENGESLYGFIHRTFQEYFAAADVYERYQQEEDPTIISEFLKEHLHDPHWREVILLLLGKLKRKPATVQLRHILEGKIKSCRSQFTDVVQQDLFFVYTCLIEGIVVEIELAELVISLLCEILKTSPFSTQRIRALNALATLIRLRQFKDLVFTKIKELIIQNPITDISTRIQVAQVLYAFSAPNSEEQSYVSRVLYDIIRQQHSSMEDTVQAAQALYRISQPHSREQKQAIYTLIRAQNDILSYMFHTPLSSVKQSSFSFTQLAQIMKIFYQNTRPDSDERHQVLDMITELSQKQELSKEQRLQIAIVPLKIDKPNYSDRMHAVEMVLKIIRSQSDFLNKVDVSDIPLIFSYSTQLTLPVEFRNEMYRLLHDMVPQFDKIPSPTT